MTERMPVKVLGAELGTADGWDQSAELAYMFYDFLPAAPWLEFFKNVNGGDLFLNYETGEWTITKEVVVAEFPVKGSKIASFSGKFSSPLATP